MSRQPVSQPPSPPLTVRQAAELLAVSPTIIYEACASGRLRHFRFGQGKRRACIRIYRTDLDAWMEACGAGGPPIESRQRKGRGGAMDDDQLGEGLPESLTRHWPAGWENQISAPVGG